MRLQHIKVLVTVAETGSIRSAARRLGLTQPALSKSIRQLETEFGVQMLSRTSRGVVLTDYGKAVLARAKGIHAELKRLEDEVAQMRGKRDGSVSIAVAPLPSLMILPAVLPAFCKQHPSIDVRIVDGIFPSVLPLVREGEVDFAIGPAPPKGIVGELDVERLMSSDLVVAARVKHPLAAARKLADLQSAPWMRLGALGSPGDALAETFAAHDLPPPKTMIRSDSFASSLALIETTDFLCILPKRLTTQLQKQQRVTVIRLNEPLPPVTVALLRRSNMPLTPAATSLATLVRRRANILNKS